MRALGHGALQSLEGRKAAHHADPYHHSGDQDQQYLRQHHAEQDLARELVARRRARAEDDGPLEALLANQESLTAPYLRRMTRV